MVVEEVEVVAVEAEEVEVVLLQEVQEEVLIILISADVLTFFKIRLNLRAVSYTHLTLPTILLV